MSYQVLARKWRPRFFREMVGQEHVLQALINALDHNRLHHAYLFTGTRGVGKTTIARILAKCLNCEVGVSSEPCGQCSACKEIAAGSFVDLIEVDAASRTKVEDTRELLDNVQYAPTKGRFKVYLIDEVHMLSTHSFNALLKTLEEPPEHVKFLLATTDPQKLPATILSRCLQFHLKNMSPERIVSHLQTILEHERLQFEPPALWLLARAANGSMRDALSLTDQAIAFGTGTVLEHDVTSMLGSIDLNAIYTLTQGLIDYNPQAILAEVARLSEHAPDFVQVLDELLMLLHRMSLAQLDAACVDNSQGDQEKVTALAAQLSAEELQLFYQMGIVGKRDISLAPDMRSGFEMTLLRMLTFRPQGVQEPPVRDLPSHDRAAGADLPASQAAHPGNVAEPDQAKAGSLKKPSAPIAATDNHHIDIKVPLEPTKAELELKQANEPSLSASKPESISAAAYATEAELVSENEPAVDANTVSKAASKAELKEQPAPQQTSESVLEIKARSDELNHANNQDALFKASESETPEPKTSIAQQPAISEAALPSNHQEWLALLPALPVEGLLSAICQECVLVQAALPALKFVINQDNAQLFNARHAEQLQQQLAAATGQTPAVSIEPLESTEFSAAVGSKLSAAELVNRQQQHDQAQAEQALASDELLADMLSTFNGQLIASSIKIIPQ
ncbi:MAG: DNA polymerase III subunit gamma/tau [Pseudomonadales bacterium]|nr:DNA polymerase III subunit gamma/tau [Pseudomonadales bacterium]